MMILFSERMAAQIAFHQWCKEKDKAFNAAHEENIHITPNLMSAIVWMLETNTGHDLVRAMAVEISKEYRAGIPEALKAAGLIK